MRPGTLGRNGRGSGRRPAGVRQRPGEAGRRPRGAARPATRSSVAVDAGRQDGQAVRELEGAGASRARASYARRVPSHLAKRRPSWPNACTEPARRRRRPARRAGARARPCGRSGPRHRRQRRLASRRRQLHHVAGAADRRREHDLDALSRPARRTEVLEPARMPSTVRRGGPRRELPDHRSSRPTAAARLVAMGFTRAELAVRSATSRCPTCSRRRRSRCGCCSSGINPGLWTGRRRRPTSPAPGNRFYPALLRAGDPEAVTIDPSRRDDREDLDALPGRGHRRSPTWWRAPLREWPGPSPPTRRRRIVSGGNNDVSRYGEIVERSLVHQGLRHYFLVSFPQEPGALRHFPRRGARGRRGHRGLRLRQEEQPRDRTGPGRDRARHAAGLAGLLDRMEVSPVTIERVPPGSPLFTFLM